MPVSLDVLSQDDAATLIGRMIGLRRAAAEPSAVAELAGLCAYLPLALRIAAANLATRPGYRVADYVARLHAGDRLAALAVDDDAAGAVRATFELSCDALPATERRLFRLLGLVPGPDVSADAAAALAGLPDAERLLNLLTGRHLVQEYAPGRYSLHDLLRLYAAGLSRAEDGTEDGRAAILRLAAYYRAGVAEAAQFLYPNLLHLPLPDAPKPDGGARPGRFADRAAAMAWLEAERPNLVATIVHLAGHDHHAEAWAMADLLNGYFVLRMHLTDWRTVAEAGAAAAEADGDPLARAATELNLGMELLARVRTEECLERFGRAAELAREAGWLECEAVAVNNIAAGVWAAGRVDEAVDRLTEALELHRAAGRRAGEAVTLANLAVTRQERGDSPELVTGLLMEALAIHMDAGDTRSKATTLRVLAEIHRDTGELDQALEFALEAVRVAEVTDDARALVSTLSILATIHVMLGDEHAGLDHHVRALRLAVEADVPIRAGVLADMADSHRRLGKLDDALIEAEDALALARQLGARVLERRAHRSLDAVMALRES